MVNKKAFTLVELTVSIMILLVISAVAVISVRWYTTSARDASRIADVTTIEQMLEVHLTLNNKTYLPENKVDINFWTEKKIIQWNFTETIQKEFNLSKFFKDPETSKYLTYSVSADRKLYQIVTILERELITDDREKANTTIFDYKKQKAFPYVAWNKVWAVLSFDNLNGIHEKNQDFNLLAPTEPVIYIEENWEELKELNATNTSEILLYLSSLKNISSCKWMKEEFWTNAVSWNYSLRLTSKTREIKFCDMSLN